MTGLFAQIYWSSLAVEKLSWWKKLRNKFSLQDCYFHLSNSKQYDREKGTKKENKKEGSKERKGKEEKKEKSNWHSVASFDGLVILVISGENGASGLLYSDKCQSNTHGVGVVFATCLNDQDCSRGQSGWLCKLFMLLKPCVFIKKHSIDVFTFLIPLGELNHYPKFSAFAYT